MTVNICLAVVYVAWMVFMLLHHKKDCRLFRFKTRVNILELRRDVMVIENNFRNKMGFPLRYSEEDFESIRREAQVILSVFESGKELAKTEKKK